MPLSSRHVRLLSIILIAVVLTGCGPGQAAAPTRSPTPTARALLELASRRLAETPSAHFALMVEGETFIDSAKSIRLLGAEGDLQRPDRVQTTFQAEVMGRAISLQLVTIGKKSWTTNILTGEWTTAPLEFAYRPDILFSTQDGIGPVMGRVTNVTRLADEEIADKAAYHLHADVDELVVGPLTYYTISGSPVSVDLWINTETYDLLRARLAEPPGAERPHPAVWTLNLSRQGKDVVIDPPA